MGIKRYDQQLVTGVAISGTTDNLGAWSSANLAPQLTSLPASSKGVLVKVLNTTSSPRWAGIRTNGKTNPEFLLDIPANSVYFYFIPFPSANKIIDFYKESESVEFRIIGALDGTFEFFNIDGVRPTIASTSGVLATRNISSCPEDATVITTGVKWCPQSETTTFANTVGGQQLIKVDSNKDVKINTSGTPTIIGYTTGDAGWLPWLATTEAYTADSTWRTAAGTQTGKTILFVGIDKSTTTNDFDFRSTGSAYNPTVTGSAFDENFYTDLSASGGWDYAAETGSTGSMYLMAAIGDYEAVGVSITDIDQFIAGEPFNITFSDPAFEATEIAVNDGDVIKTIPVTDGSGVAPMWAADAACLKFGNVTITATDGVDDSEPYIQSYSVFIGYQSVSLSSVSLSNYRAGTSPALKVSSLIAHPSAIAVGADGGVDSGSASGTYLVYDRDPDDFICRTYTLNYLAEPSGDDRGLTARGLTAVGLTATGLTAVGL